MSPRPYRLGQRQVAVEQTRTRILRAARELLTDNAGFAGFSIDAVARQADVARMTVYHQFGSKIGLLEGLCDSLAESGSMQETAAAFREEDGFAALRHYLHIFGRFWSVDRLVMRRLRALAALDPDFEQVIRARDERRRHGVHVIAQRIVEQQAHSTTRPLDEIVVVLLTLSSFETFDTLAGPDRSPQEVAPLVFQLARLVFEQSR